MTLLLLKLQLLQITHKLVDVSLALSFCDDFFVIIVSKSPRKFFVIHLGFVFAAAPQTSDLVGVMQFELPGHVTGPGNDDLFGRIHEQFKEKLPQLNWSAC